MMQGFVVGTHGTRQQPWVAHLVMGGLENGFTIGRQTRHKGIVRVHPDLFEQVRGAEVDNHEEGYFLDGLIHHELEHALQGNPAASDGLEYWRKGGRCGIEFGQETLGKGVYAVKAFKSAVRCIDCRFFVPEQLFLTEQ